MTFTEKSLNRVKLGPGESRLVFRDPKDKSLMLYVQPRGKTWYSRVNGSDKSIGRFPALSIDDARQIHRKRSLETKGHIMPTLTLGQYIDEHDVPKSDSKTVPAKSRNLKNAFLKSGVDFWDKRIQDIRSQDIEDWRQEYIEDHGVANGTLNSYTVYLKAALGRAVKRGFLPHHPLADFKQLPEDHHRVRYLLNDERERFMAQLDKRNDFLKPFCLVALNTGMRRNEILSMRYEHLDLTARVIRIPETKSGKHQTVPMNDKVLQAIKGWSGGKLPSRGFIFANSDGAQRHGRMKVWDRFIDSCDIDDFRIHDMRHDFASQLVLKGVNIYEVQKLMRHSDIKLTQRYAHLRDESLLNAVNLL
ncbi:MAG: site-specific integrase [Litoricolaceae bacterium]|nr:site-specific integrase [Litorivicinaceae bacterium]